MGGIFGKSKRTAPTIAAGVQLQTSTYGSPIPLIYGTTRVPPNLIWYGSFLAIAQNQGGGGGGKGGAFGGGGGGKGGGSSNYVYQTALQMAFGEGPLQGVGDVYVDKNVYALSDLGLSFFNGEYPQSPWGYLSSSYPAQALGYNGISYVASPTYQLGNSPQLPNNNFEVQGIFSNSVQQEIVGEQDTIPGSPYQITVQFAAEFIADSGVTDSLGNKLTKVSSPTGTYQYSVSAGVYTFYSGDVNVVVNINYTASVGPDADPSLVINDFLTNAHYGAGFPSSRVGSLAIYQAYCIAIGLLISPFYNTQQQASSMLDDIATMTNSGFVWSSGVLTLVPYGDQSVTANGYTYTAPSSPLYSLTDDDFEPNQSTTTSVMSDDPVILTRTRPADQINSIKLECLDRNNQYNPAVIEAKDQALIENFGLRQSPSGQSHLFCNLASGRLSAQLQLGRQAIRNMYSFTVDQRYIVLDPMDIIAITDSYLGLNQQWVRVVEITENDDGTLSISAEEYLAGTASAPAYSFQQGSGYTADYNTSPGSANTPILFVPAIELAATGLEVWLAASGVNTALWGGCDVWISQDGTNYKNVGRVNGPARMGVLTSLLPIGTDPDTTDTLAVNLTESLGELLSGTQADADSYVTLCYVDGEMVSYETATLTSANNYGLTYLRRGGYGTTIAAHANGSQFARLDNGIFKFTINKNQIGTTVYIKLLSFNLWGSGEQSLADVSATTFVVPFPPPPAQVQNFSAQQQGNVVVFGWDDLTPYDVGLKGYDIAFGPPASAWSAKELLTEASRATEMTNAAVPPGTWEFSIRAHDIADQLSPVISTVELIVVNQNNIIAQVVQETGWLGTLVNFTLHYTGVLIPNSLHTPSYYALISPPTAPTTGTVVGGALGLTTYYVKITYVDATGETTVSGETTQIVPALSLLTVASPGASGLAIGYNVYVSTTSGAETLQNASPIGLTATWTEPSTGLITGASAPTLNSTGMQWVDEFVPDPVSSASYTAPTIDTGYNDNLRVYASSAAVLGPSQSGAGANLQLAIDTWLTGQSDPNVYTPWTIGFVLMRYLNAQLTYSGITGGDVSYITDFTPTADVSPTTEQASGAVIAPGGTVVTFPTPYHTNPYVVVSVVGSTALYATATAIGTTGFTAHVWDSSGSDIGGTINWAATGS